MKLLSIVSAVLLAGVSYAAADLNFDAGENHIFSIIAAGRQIVSCHLKPPLRAVMDFVPGEESPNADRYVLQPIGTGVQFCSILVNNLQESDTGDWELSYKSSDGAEVSTTFPITVTGTEPQDHTEPSEDDHIEWLNAIEFPTRTGQIIHISLSKTENEEKCTVRPPDGDSIRASEVNIDGVTVHGSSDFVSCRISIGPMVESLLGEWAVCGTYTENEIEHERCQPATIFWNNNNDPDRIWSSVIHPLFDHPVHFGHTLSPVVIGNGEIVTCHVITPDGEDLVIDQESQYPGIKAATMAYSICSIAIGPIDASKIGNWTIYGIFRNAVAAGVNEARLPINMFLYDEENPYSQAYNVTVLDSVQRVVNLGNTLYVEVFDRAGQVDSCQIVNPSGQLYDKKDHDSTAGVTFIDEKDTVACGAAIGPINEERLGEWKLIGKFNNNGLFTERQQTFKIVQEDPENPIVEDRTIMYINSQTVNTEMGEKTRLVINSDIFIDSESCHIRTPDGLQFKIMEGFNVSGVEVIEEPDIECGVIINVLSEDVIGEWTLIARASRFSEAIERRLPFTIYVEESVEALPNEVIITEGNDLYVRLKYPTDDYESCKLIGPFGIECASAVRDSLHVESCGFIRRDVQIFNTGTWTITYGNKIVYKAEIVVTVNTGNAGTDSFAHTLTLVRDLPVEKAVGPENAVYCRLEDPQGLAVFDGFGRCTLSLDKVEMKHHGTWKLLVGAPGRVLTDEYELFINVRESEGKAVVTTQVAQEKPIVTVSCSVASDADVRACKFRNPQGKILLAAAGVSEDRYSFHGNQVSYESEVKTHQCGLTITNPLTTDLGLWRCAMETSEDTYYGHMAVLCPWALMNSTVAATVQQEPLLTTNRALVNVVEEEPAIMSCSVESDIRYCYFRAANGTTFAVTPGMSSPTMEYFGAGFDAGECGVRFHGMLATDSGRWGCHVGLVGDHEEQRDLFQVTVHERMSVNHFNSHGNIMTVEGKVYEGRALEYCRFVRIDGFGFTTDNVPSQYTLTGILAIGECQFTARNPSILDLHPWTVVARIRGQDVEISKDTMEAILIFPPTTEPTPEPGQEVQPGPHSPGPNGLAIFLYVFMGLLVVAILLGVCFGPKKHRNWTAQRASTFRRSLSNSFRKQPPQHLGMPAPVPNQQQGY